MAHGVELYIGGLEPADVFHNLHPPAFGVDGHKSVVGAAELLIGHGHRRAMRFEVIDGLPCVGHDPADVVDARAVLGKPLALILELIRRGLEWQLERGAAGQEGVVDAALAGLVHVGIPVPVIRRDGVIPLQPVPHRVAGMPLVDAQVMELVARHVSLRIAEVGQWYRSSLKGAAQRSGAGDENRTRVISLGSWGSTTELHPQVPGTLANPERRCPPVRRSHESEGPCQSS